MKKILSILVRNRPGVLSHVAGLVTRRGYNVESIAAGPTENRAITRITLVVAGEGPVLEQVAKQVGKLVDVINLDDLPLDEAMTGELAIITVRSERSKRSEMVNLVNLLSLTLTDIRDDSLSVMAAGSARQVQMAISALKPFGILAMARTGLVALSRPSDPAHQDEEDD
ncbi:MAG: acetolactate synthase small subunit [Deltaproteobacteria bacterium]|jgi:acetolactate synthase-1/3 small subunit|nr:acetolactate synthase small subunit [Deltaproteobacteria bacterium]